MRLTAQITHAVSYDDDDDFRADTVMHNDSNFGSYVSAGMIVTPVQNTWSNQDLMLAIGSLSDAFVCSSIK